MASQCRQVTLSSKEPSISSKVNSMEKSLGDGTGHRALLQGTSAPECQGFPTNSDSCSCHRKVFGAEKGTLGI